MRRDLPEIEGRRDPHGLDDLAAEAVQTFQPFYDEPLTQKDGREMVRNMSDVLMLLSEWKREATPAAPVSEPEPAEPVVPAKPTRKRRARRFPAETP